MSNPYPKSQWDLENDVLRLEQMIILYEQEIAELKIEKKELLEEVSILQRKLEYYDAYFGMCSDSLSEDSEFDVDDSATKAQIKRAFVKSLKVKKLNKKVLGEFISLVV